MTKKKEFKLPEEMQVKCPKCKSKNVVKTGHICNFTSSAARWWCKDCNHHFEEGNWDKEVMKGFCPGMTR